MKSFGDIYCHQLFYDGYWFCIIIVVRNSVSCRQEMVLHFCTRTVVNEWYNRTFFFSKVKFIILILDCLGCTFPKNPLHNASWHMLVGERDDDEIIFWWLTWLQLFAAGICIMRWYTIMMYTKTEDLYRLCKGLQMLDKKHQNSFDHYIRLIDLHYCCVISATSVISYYFLTKYD